MKITKITATKAAAGLGVAKLALFSTVVHAAGAGKADAPKADAIAPPLHMDQIGYPFKLITPPMAQVDDGSGMGGKADPAQRDDMGVSPRPNLDGNLAQPPKDSKPQTSNPRDAAMNLRKNNVGTIWTGAFPPVKPDGGFQENTPHPRMDFLIDGIRNDIPMQVFLAFTVDKPGDYPWPGLKSGKIQISPELNTKTHILAGVMTQPDVAMLEPPTPFGKQRPNKFRTVSVSVALSNLKGIPGGNVCFQAVAVPAQPGANGDLNWAEAQASEIDCYRIARDMPEATGDQGSKDDMPIEQGGKSGTYADADMYDPNTLQATGTTEEAASGKAGSSTTTTPTQPASGTSSGGLGGGK